MIGVNGTLILLSLKIKLKELNLKRFTVPERQCSRQASDFQPNLNTTAPTPTALHEYADTERKEKVMEGKEGRKEGGRERERGRKRGMEGGCSTVALDHLGPGVTAPWTAGSPSSYHRDI